MHNATIQQYQQCACKLESDHWHVSNRSVSKKQCRFILLPMSVVSWITDGVSAYDLQSNYNVSKDALRTFHCTKNDVEWYKLNMLCYSSRCGSTVHHSQARNPPVITGKGATRLVRPAPSIRRSIQHQQLSEIHIPVTWFCPIDWPISLKYNPQTV